MNYPATGYMAICGGHKVYLDCPVPEDFDPYRTGFALSHANRYGGNYGPFSVAQHAVLVSLVAKQLARDKHSEAIEKIWDECDHLDGCGSVYAKEDALVSPYALAGLHHDDSESVTGDLPRPVKALCPDFRALEERLTRMVERRYGVSILNNEIVEEADRIVFAAEVRWIVPREHHHLYEVSPFYRKDKQPNGTLLAFWSPDRACKEYLVLHEQLEGLCRIP